MRRPSSKLHQPSETRQRAGLTLGAMNCDPRSKLSVRLLASVELSAGRTGRIMLIGKSGETIAEHNKQGMLTRNNRRGGMTRFRIAGMWGVLITRWCFRTFLPNARSFRGRVWVLNAFRCRFQKTIKVFDVMILLSG